MWGVTNGSGVPCALAAYLDHKVVTRRSHHRRAHGVELDVAVAPQEVGAALRGACLVSALPQGAGATEPVVGRHVPAKHVTFGRSSASE